MSDSLIKNNYSRDEILRIIKKQQILKKLYPYNSEKIISEMRVDGGACGYLDWEEIWKRLKLLIQQDDNFKAMFMYDAKDEHNVKPLIIKILTEAFQEEYPKGSSTERSIEEMLDLF